MYAVLTIGGHQFKVSKDQSLYVNRLPQEEGAEVEFDQILAVGDDESKEFHIGKPTVANAKVKVKVLEHLKGDKVIVFKKKRRKGYRKKNGHRQHLSKILIESINI